MAVNIKVTGIKKAKSFLRKESKKKLFKANNAIHQAGLFVEGQVKMSIQGRAAEAASVDTGRFLNSVRTVNKFLTSEVKSDVKYAKFLEFGTSRVGPRNHFRNTAARSKVKVQAFVSNALK